MSINIKIDPELKITPEELRKAYPWAVRAHTREQVEADIRRQMGKLGMAEADLPNLMKRWEETYGFKEEAENEFGEVSP